LFDISLLKNFVFTETLKDLWLGKFIVLGMLSRSPELELREFIDYN
jgi:hypothetical protein